MSTASFTYTVNGLRADFVDESVGIIDSWHWDFGDGRTSTDQDPVHVYFKAGTFTVILTITDTGEEYTYSRDVTVVGTRSGTALNPEGIHGEHTHVGGLVGDLKKQLPFFTRRRPNWY